MKKLILILIIGMPLSLFANNPEKSKNYSNALHQEKCTSCHSDQMYTRKNRKISNLNGLGAQVRRCKNNLGIEWFDDEVDEVVTFLNDAYYHF